MFVKNRHDKGWPKTKEQNSDRSYGQISVKRISNSERVFQLARESREEKSGTLREPEQIQSGNLSITDDAG
jgi:hypothetical protein